MAEPLDVIPALRRVAEVVVGLDLADGLVLAALLSHPYAAMRTRVWPGQPAVTDGFGHRCLRSRDRVVLDALARAVPSLHDLVAVRLQHAVHAVAVQAVVHFTSVALQITP